MSEIGDNAIITLEWDEHIRIRPGMYIGKLGDGSAHDDGIYILLKEVLDNSVDEYMKGYGKHIELKIKDNTIQIRDNGRGVPLNKLIDCVARMNTGANFKENRGIGMNGVGLKAVNALSTFFQITSFVNGNTKTAEFSCGKLVRESEIELTTESNGTRISFTPDGTLFKNFHWYNEYMDKMLWNYAYLNRGLTLHFNGSKYVSKNGLLDLIRNNVTSAMLYDPIHLREEGFECVLVHTQRRYGEEYYSFVNGQYTIHGGTHQQAFREAVVKTIRDFYKKDFDPNDIRNAVLAALFVRVVEPLFDSQTKTKLGSTHIEPEKQTIKNFMNDVVGRLLDKHLHMHKEVADAILKKILESEKERKEIAGVKKAAKDAQKKTSIYNSKLRDCTVHLTKKHARALETTLFITEGDSASGSIAQSRDSETQAIFSLRGKIPNTYKAPKRILYDNEELRMLQAALKMDEGIEALPYNNIVIATDADDDGMHIRLLLLTFFLDYFSDLVKSGHLYILETPLFRVRNKNKTLYCYTETERSDAIKTLGGKPEITRFKGLGEISPKEFKDFIGKDIRLSPVVLDKSTPIDSLLKFYMGDNTEERKQLIIEQLRDEI